MRGTIIQYDTLSKSGLVSGNDDQRYHFEATDIAKDQQLAIGRQVDFNIVDGNAHDIYLIKNHNDFKGISSSMPAIIYGLYIANCFFPLLSIVGVILAYVSRGDSLSTDRDKSLYRNQIRMFWYAFLFTIIGTITLFFIIGYFILLAVYIWWFIASIVGLVRALD